MPIKLNLGCGRDIKEGYINIDIYEPCDFKHDLRDLLPFDDESVDEIYNKVGIDLFTQDEWLNILFDNKRVLKKGGKMEIICRDLDYVAKKFLEADYKTKWDHWLRFIHMPPANECDIFKNGFNAERLINDLKMAGMENIEQIERTDPMLIHVICYKPHYSPRTMKILIGTPIHECKDYCMERWLENVSKNTYLADLLLMDNSPGLDYVEKVKGYCEKYGIKNYKIEHIDVWQPNGADERKGRAREAIRQYVLAHDYDAWFSWESDQIIPADALGKLASIMEKGNFMMVNPNSWKREGPTVPEAGFGCILIRRDGLEKCGFLLEHYPGLGCWLECEAQFKKTILKNGGNYIEIFGAIGPIIHLKE